MRLATRKGYPTWAAASRIAVDPGAPSPVAEISLPAPRHLTQLSSDVRTMRSSPHPLPPRAHGRLKATPLRGLPVGPGQPEAALRADALTRWSPPVGTRSCRWTNRCAHVGEQPPGAPCGAPVAPRRCTPVETIDAPVRPSSPRRRHAGGVPGCGHSRSRGRVVR